MASIWVVTAASAAVDLDPARTGEITFTVTNTGAGTGRAVFEIVAPDGADPSWFTVVEPQRTVRAGASVSFLVRIAADPAAPPGAYPVQGLVYSADDAPEEGSVRSGRVAVGVASPAQPPPPRRPWWLVAVAALVVLVLVVVGWLVFGRGGTPTVAASGGPGAPARTALRFDGAHDGVTLADSPALNITGLITIEAWIRPTDTTGLRDIVVRGYVANPPGEIYLRINNGQYQLGNWQASAGDSATSVAIPAGDKGTWVHLAGVFDGTSWRLYRDGRLAASTLGSKGAVPVAGPWAIGKAGSSADRYFAGDLDEVRIWDWARNPQQLNDDMSRRLTGTEAGLAGYFYARDGALVDHSPNHIGTTVQGAPAAADAPPALTGPTG